jgi:hypothetical protein
MIDLFANPGYVAAGGALISSPIIIHLINRMRFKRLRWAAMEFLLKAQKKSRRRLIIEQLLLLLLRCLLVLLTALLVSRFLGCSLNAQGGETETLHVVILDDTLSMTDHWEKDGPQDAFSVGKKLISKNIVDNLKQSNNIERLVIVPLSKLATDPKYKIPTYPRLSDTGVSEAIEKDLAEMQPTKLHIDMMLGIEKAKKYIAENPNNKVVIHVVSDFRKPDWTGPESRPLHRALLEMTRGQDRVRVRLLDTVHPNRAEGALPVARDNLAIVDFQSATRVAPRGKRVEFRVTVANYSASEASVGLVIYNDVDGQEVFDADFKDRMPLSVPAMGTATARFEKAFNPPEGKENETQYIRLAAHLVSPDRSALKNDGIKEDNVRHAGVEIRSQVPILLVDGLGAKGLEFQDFVLHKPVDDGKGGKVEKEFKIKIMGDSLAVSKAIESFEGKRDKGDKDGKEKASIYKIVHGHELVGGDARKALASPDLEKYQTIILMNVPSLTDEQLARLEKYVRDGGGVAFFLGPKVREDANVGYYNKFLYADGQGLFPVPLENETIPPRDDKKELERSSKQFQLLLRGDQFGSDEQVPIFGEFLKQKKSQKDWLKHLPVKRYFPAQPRHNWRGDPAKVKEIFTRPNNMPIKDYAAAARKIAQALPRDPARDKDFKAYHPGLKIFADRILQMITPGVTDEDKDSPYFKTPLEDKPAYFLADVLDEMLNYRGQVKDLKNFPNLTEFWNLPDPRVTDLRAQVVELRQELRYSHPMMVVNQYGQGRVVAVMTTAGQEWNEWAGGITGDFVYAPILFEMQNYLSSQGGSSSQLVGPNVQVHVDASQYKKPLKLVREFFRPEFGKAETKLDPETALAVTAAPDAKKDKDKDKDGEQKEVPSANFVFPNTPEPGFALLKLYYEDSPEGADPLEVRSQVYNVDARREGNLQRTTQDDMEGNVMREANAGRSAENQAIVFTGPDDSGETLVARPDDLSQMPWFFLLFLFILVAEQALAVHLSFHLKSSEAELPAQVVKPQARAA